MRKIGLFSIVFLCFLIVSCGGTKATKKTENPGDLYVQGVNLLKKKSYTDAIEKFMKIRENFPFDPITAIAEVKLGDAYFEKKEYLLAAGIYEDFFNAHPEDDNIPYVLRRLGECYSRLSPSIDRDQAFTVKAIERFTYLKNRYPQSTYTKEVETQIALLTGKQAAHELYVAEYYHRTERYNASILRFEYFLARYPKAPHRDKALFLLADCYSKLSDPLKNRYYLDQLRKEFPKSIYAASSLRRTAATASRPQADKKDSPQVRKTAALTLADTPPSKRKEIDLRPPQPPQDGAFVTDQTAGFSGPKSTPVTAPLSAPSSDHQTGPRKESSSPVPTTQTPSGESGSEARMQDPEAVNKGGPETVRKKDQKGSLGFFSTEKKPIDVVSDTMEGLEKGKVIIFKGNVVAKQGDLEMFSDTLTAYLSEETNEIERALAKGHVKIIKQDRIATCEDALFENAKGEITLRGNVIVFSGPNKVAGDTVKYLLNEDRVWVESEKGKRARMTVHPKQ